MRRLAAITLTLAVAGALAALAISASAQGSSAARFDVIFDDARGLVGGQLVKIAGANAGTIQNVVVTPDFKARIEATVDGRFMPFHQNATCAIRPQGLIAENYIDCDPGTADSPPLRGFGGHPPTVPVTNTTEPVGLLDFFNTFNLPTRERFTVLINELGIGTAARGEDLNDILRRANPALALARQAISILERQRAQLATIISASNTLATQGATHTGAVQSFLDRSSALGTLTAAHRDSLSQAIARLPGLLAAAQPALQQLDTVAVDGTPLVQQIHAAVPSLNRVASDLGPFVAVAKPGLASLGAALQRGIPAIRHLTPLIGELSTYTKDSLPSALLFSKLLANLQQHGFFENFLSVGYYVAAQLSRFDATSHLLPLLFVDPEKGPCGNPATTPIPACSAHFGQQPSYQPSPALAQQAAGDAPAAAPGPPAAAPGAAPPAPTPGATHPGTGRAQSSQTLQNLVDYLLK